MVQLYADVQEKYLSSLWLKVANSSTYSVPAIHSRSSSGSRRYTKIYQKVQHEGFK